MKRIFSILIIVFVILLINLFNCASKEYFCVPHVFTGNLDFCLGDAIEDLKKEYKPNKGGFIETLYYLRFYNYDFFHSIYFHPDFWGKKVNKIALGGYGETIMQSDSLARVIIKLLIHQYGDNFKIRECIVGIEDDLLPVFIWKIRNKGYIIFRYYPYILYEKKIVSGKKHNYELVFERQLDVYCRDCPESKTYTKLLLGVE